MCTVEVLIFSDVMRHTYNSIAAPRPSARSICRRLFADEAPVARSTSSVLRDLQADIDREARERWNFDFKTETPLPGRYQWEPVNPNARRVPTADNIVAEVPTEEKQSTTAPQTSRSKKAMQSKITDFLQQRKRQRVGESSLFSPKQKLRRLDEYSSKDRPARSTTTSVLNGSTKSADD